MHARRHRARREVCRIDDRADALREVALERVSETGARGLGCVTVAALALEQMPADLQFLSVAHALERQSAVTDQPAGRVEALDRPQPEAVLRVVLQVPLDPTREAGGFAHQ